MQTRKFQLISTIKHAESLLSLLKINSYCSLHPENLIAYACERKKLHCSVCLQELTEKCFSAFRVFSIDFLLKSFRKQLKDLKAFILLMLKKEFLDVEINASKPSKVNKLVNEIERNMNILILISLEKSKSGKFSEDEKLNSSTAGKVISSSEIDDSSYCAFIENFSVQLQLIENNDYSLAPDNLKRQSSEAAESKKSKKFNKKVSEINKILTKLLTNKKCLFEMENKENKENFMAGDIEKIRRNLKGQIVSKDEDDFNFNFNEFLLNEISFLKIDIVDASWITIMIKFLTENYIAKLLEAISAYEFTQNSEKKEKHFFQLKEEFNKCSSSLNTTEKEKLADAPQDSEREHHSSEVKINYVPEKYEGVNFAENATARNNFYSKPYLLTLENLNINFNDYVNNNKNKVIFINKNNDQSIKNELLDKKEANKISSLDSDQDEKGSREYNSISQCAGNDISDEKSKLRKVEEIKSNLFKIAQLKNNKVYNAFKSKASFQNSSVSNNSSNLLIDNVLCTSSKESQDNNKTYNNDNINSLIKTKAEEISLDKIASKKLCFETSTENSNKGFDNKPSDSPQKLNNSQQNQNSIQANDSSDKAENSYLSSKSLLKATTAADKVEDSISQTEKDSKSKIILKSKKSCVKNQEFFSISNSFISDYSSSKKGAYAPALGIGEKYKNAKTETSKQEAFSDQESLNFKAESCNNNSYENEDETIYDHHSPEKDASAEYESENIHASAINKLSDSFIEKFNKFKVENFPHCSITQNLKESYIINQKRFKKSFNLQEVQQSINSSSEEKTDFCNRKFPRKEKQEFNYHAYPSGSQEKINKHKKASHENESKMISNRTIKEFFLGKEKSEKLCSESLSLNNYNLNNQNQNFFQNDILRNAAQAVTSNANDDIPCCIQTKKQHYNSNKYNKDKNYNFPLMNKNKNYERKEDSNSALILRRCSEEKKKNDFRNNNYKFKCKESTDNNEKKLISEKVLNEHQQKLKIKKEFKISKQSDFRTKQKIDLDSHVIYLADDSEDSIKLESESFVAAAAHLEIKSKDENDSNNPRFKNQYNDNKLFFKENKEVPRNIEEKKAAEHNHTKTAAAVVKNNTEDISFYKDLLRAQESESSYQTLKIKSSACNRKKENSDLKQIVNKNTKHTNDSNNNTSSKKKSYNFELDKSDNYFVSDISDNSKTIVEEKVSNNKASLIQKESSALTEKTRLNERDSKQLLNLLVLLSNSVNLDDASSALNNNIPNISLIQKALLGYSNNKEKRIEPAASSGFSLKKCESISNSRMLNQKQNTQNTLNNKENTFKDNLIQENINNKSIDKFNNSLKIISVKNKASEHAQQHKDNIIKESQMISDFKKPKAKAASAANEFITINNAKACNESKSQKADYSMKNDSEELLRKALMGSSINSSVIKAHSEYSSCVDCGVKFIFYKGSNQRILKCDNCERSSD